MGAEDEVSSGAGRPGSGCAGTQIHSGLLGAGRAQNLGAEAHGCEAPARAGWFLTCWVVWTRDFGATSLKPAGAELHSPRLLSVTWGWSLLAGGRGGGLHGSSLRHCQPHTTTIAALTLWRSHPSRGVFPRFQSPGSLREQELVTTALRGLEGRIRVRAGCARTRPAPLSRYWPEGSGFCLEMERGESRGCWGGGTLIGPFAYGAVPERSNFPPVPLAFPGSGL